MTMKREDRRDTAERRRACLALDVVLERIRVPDMRVRLDHAREDVLAGKVDLAGRALSSLPARQDGGDPPSGDPEIRAVDAVHGVYEGRVAQHEIKHHASFANRPSSAERT